MTDAARPLRVVHCPVNTAGVPWSNVQALRRRGVDATLVVFNRYKLHPEADVSLERRGGFVRKQATQWRALAGLAPRTDVFHFYFGLTLVPQSVQFPILRALGKKSVMHYLGSDIRGKTPEELAFGKKAGAEVVGSYDAIRWVPEAEFIPPGIDVQRIEPSPPSDRSRPVILHAPSSRRRKGTDEVIAACEGLDADLVLVEGLHHTEAFERYREADIVIDQLNAGWYGLFAIECMALGKPVVSFLHEEAVRRTESELGERVPIVRATKDDLRDDARAARRVRSRAEAHRRRVAALRRAGARPRARRRPPARPLRSPLEVALGSQLKRLGKHSAIYGLGGLVSRILAVLLLPLYTRYLSPADYGKVETLIALTTVVGIVAAHGDLERVLPLLLRLARARAPSPRSPHVVLVHDDHGHVGMIAGIALSSPDRRRPLRDDRQRGPRRGLVRRSLVRDELRAADVALPGRGALGCVRRREPREHPPHDRRHTRPRRRSRQGPARESSSGTSPARSSSTSCSWATAESSSASSSTATSSGR